MRVRFAARYGLNSDIELGPKSAITGLVHRYSITSSARTSNEGGTVRPRALAFKLITSSYLGRLLYRQVDRLSTLRVLST